MCDIAYNFGNRILNTMVKKNFLKKKSWPKNFKKRDFVAVNSEKMAKSKNFDPISFWSESMQNVLKRFIKRKFRN